MLPRPRAVGKMPRTSLVLALISIGGLLVLSLMTLQPSRTSTSPAQIIPEQTAQPSSLIQTVQVQSSTPAIVATAPSISPFPQLTSVVYTAAPYASVISETDFYASATIYLLTPRSPVAVFHPRNQIRATSTAENSATAIRMATEYVATIKYIFADLTPATVIEQSVFTSTPTANH